MVSNGSQGVNNPMVIQALKETAATVSIGEEKIRRKEASFSNNELARSKENDGRHQGAGRVVRSVRNHDCRQGQFGGAKDAGGIGQKALSGGRRCDGRCLPVHGGKTAKIIDEMKGKSEASMEAHKWLFILLSAPTSNLQAPMGMPFRRSPPSFQGDQVATPNRGASGDTGASLGCLMFDIDDDDLDKIKMLPEWIGKGQHVSSCPKDGLAGADGIFLPWTQWTEFGSPRNDIKGVKGFPSWVAGSPYGDHDQ